MTEVSKNQGGRTTCSFLCLDVKKGTERKIKAADNFRAQYFLFAHALQLSASWRIRQ